MSDDIEWWHGPVAIYSVAKSILIVVVSTQITGDHPPGWLVAGLGIFWFVLTAWAFAPWWRLALERLGRAVAS